MLMSTPESKPAWFKFDGTINWPILFLAGGTIVGAIGFGNTVVNQMDKIQATMAEQKEAASDQAKEVKGLRETVDQIRLDMAKQDGMRSMVMDHESRLRNLEAGR